MSLINILIAEDDNWYADFLSYQLGLIPLYSVTVVKSGKELLQKIDEFPDIVTLDYHLPDMDGLKLLKRIKERSPNTEVIIVSGQNDVGVAVELLREGAYDYIVKDVDSKERLWHVVSKIKEQQSLKGRIQELEKEVRSKYNFGKLLIGQSEEFMKMFKLLEKAAQSMINVSISGETGTGKEVVAKAIHFNSAQSKNKFVTINVAAIPSELIESELFGHEKGSFTGAIAMRIGKFEEAQNGTLFIDEVGELDINSQVKLLRVLQEREIQRVGGNKTIAISCRIICATHKNLEEEVAKGNFRQDLYYRLIGLPVVLPPLRDRKEDILILAKHFIDGYVKSIKGESIQFDEGARKKLMQHTYPGNVRELKSIIDLACVMCDDSLIEAKDITFMGGTSVNNLMNGNLTLKQMTTKIILQCLDEEDQNIPAVSKRLDIGKSTIYRILKQEE